MSNLFFEAISDEIIDEKLNLLKGEKIKYRMVDKIGKTEVTIFFTNKKRAAWIAKYKKDYYGSIISNIEKQDAYTYIDVFKTLRENAIETLKQL